MTEEQKVKLNQLIQAYVAAEGRITKVMWYEHEVAKSKAAVARQRLQDYVESLTCCR